MNRRHFLQVSAAGLAMSALSNHAAEYLFDTKRKVGIIGPGWYGKCDLFRLLQIAPVEVTCMCDVDKRMAAEAAQLTSERQASGKTPRTYEDYREMLKEEELDIVLIDTPDHWHALPMIDAVRAGADVWVQKPISVDVVEGQAMVAAARKYNKVVQVGTQRRSTPHLIEARDRVIREGKLGKIGLVETYCYYHMRANGNPPNIEPPEYLNYDLWTGPAPMRPYNEWVHPRGWRAFMEYGNGILGDMCVHMFDMARWMLELGWPNSVHSSGGILVQTDSKANTPDTQTATFDYDDFPVIWQHRSWGDPPDPDYPWGATIYGDKGTLKLSVHKYDFIPRGRGGEPMHGEAVFEYDKYPIDRTEKDLERHVASAIRGHMADFLEAIAQRGKPVADIHEIHISTASCILANLSLKLGRSLKWDPVNERVIGDAEANRLLKREYRAPYTHPDPNNV